MPYEHFIGEESLIDVEGLSLEVEPKSAECGNFGFVLNYFLLAMFFVGVILLVLSVLTIIKSGFGVVIVLRGLFSLCIMIVACVWSFKIL